MPRRKGPQRSEHEANMVRVTVEFEETYGRDETKLDKLQQLCRDVGVTEGRSVTQCKKALKGTYINIVDFIEARRTNRPVRIFRSYKTLQSYIQNDRSKRYPIGLAKQNPLLTWMLIHV